MPFELKDFVSKPCSHHTGYDFLPKHALKLDLEKMANVLRSNGISIEAETPIVLLMILDNASVSLYANGKILVKDISSLLLAQKLAQKIVSALNQETQ